MSKKDDELERLIRLRDRQIRARDPQAKKRELHARLTAQRRRKMKRLSFQSLMQEIDELPHRWQGAIIGGTVGFVVLVVLAVVAEGIWTLIVGVAAIPVLALVGYIFGLSFDWRDELSDF